MRFVESGHFFQRVAIEGLEFVDDDGALLNAKVRLEMALWPDRAVLSLIAEPTQGAVGELRITAGAKHAASPSSGDPAVVELFGPKNSASAVVEVGGELSVSRSAGLGCAVVNLPAQKWKSTPGTAYPLTELDRLDRWRFTARNDSDQEITVPIMFVEEKPPAVTGFTPMLTEADGTPTGIPVQISKNWHRRPEKGDLVHQGPWFHGCTWVRLPPRTAREFTLAICYARYGGVPAASHAQLSLIGWGHNQFWDEAAIGSFGESICYEPGRVQKRCFVDDVRPLMTQSSLDSKLYGWAANGGGGDFLMWINATGSYQGFRATRTDYRAYGPCLTDVSYVEETTGGEISSRVEVALARSDDYLRAFHRVRHDVHKPVTWQRLAFYQLGADFYNATPARTVAVGNADGRREEWTPVQGQEVYDRRGVALTGAAPWISIHGVEREAVTKGNAVASRGLIVRSWRAVLGGKRCPVPYASFYANEWSRGQARTVIELSPPPGVTRLLPGDFVEAEMELVIFPADAAAYYGPNQPWKNVLAQDADTWRLVQREAAGNALKIKSKTGTLQRSYPLVLAVNRKQEAACDVAGGLGFVPVTFTGLDDYRDYELRVDGQLLNQAVHGNDFWQTDYDPGDRKWRITYNLNRDDAHPSRLEFRRRPSP